MNNVYLSLGSNRGNRQLLLEQAMELIEKKAGTIARRSSFYETSPWGLENQPDFLNMCLLLHTRIVSIDLLRVLQDIEYQLYRERIRKWGPRTVDIDILLYNDQVIVEPGLTVPHPYLQQRRFVLVPLAEIAPGVIHPVLNNTIDELLEHCPDPLPVHKVVVTQ